MLADLDDFQGVRTTGTAKGLADGQHDQVTVLHDATFDQFVFGHLQRFFGITCAFEPYRMYTAEQRDMVTNTFYLWLWTLVQA